MRVFSRCIVDISPVDISVGLLPDDTIVVHQAMAIRNLGRFRGDPAAPVRSDAALLSVLEASRAESAEPIEEVGGRSSGTIPTAGRRSIVVDSGLRRTP